MSDRTSSEPDDARRVWLMISDLVLDNQRRRAVSEALGISFGKARALRRLARRPMSMSELSSALDIDPPNASVLVNDLEKEKLVVRGPHPDDRRAKLVELTAEGRRLAEEADRILASPPSGMEALSAEQLESLEALLAEIGEGSGT